MSPDLISVGDTVNIQGIEFEVMALSLDGQTVFVKTRYAKWPDHEHILTSYPIECVTLVERRPPRARSIDTQGKNVTIDE